MAIFSGIDIKSSGLKSFLEFEMVHTGTVSIRIYNVLMIVVLLLGTRLVLWMTKKYIERKARLRNVDTGKAHAIYQIIKYVLYVIVVAIIMESIGLKLTVILAGSTALLIGLGLGVQDLFRDIVAGFVILSERTVTVGDVVEVAGMVAQVKEVGLRTTTVYTRDDIVVIIPNTKLVREQVVNWSQNRLPTRFSVMVRVDYSEEPRKVESLLLQAVADHKEIVKIPGPSVMMVDLSENYMIFTLYFFSRNLFRIERLKSDIRFSVEQKFREAGMRFAFPKREIYVHDQRTNVQDGEPKPSKD